MAKIKMRVIPEPEPSAKRAIMVLDHPGPLFTGDANMQYICGSCENVLLDGVSYKQVQGIVIKCGRCKAFNEIARAHHAH